ncbi:TPA: DUF4276 family protein [Escherichia coli]|uniref:DUF4276 family protein n=1 Tax=Escherichia coli TaxID=562 RepID=UPI0006A4151C|nr:DUF4276 family protein [Escherichia coli]AXE57077.1 DUF4276 family protein [Escherichia coli]EET5474297.1 DUF4276 family protein [Escherichia coli]EEW5130614.1 DUF4276 family protein [Escherichia coli]EEW5708780.1 DUF4276 family protein [Escherichia coli]EEW5857371.1 DUF4276 family protein [Escherichia coli]
MTTYAFFLEELSAAEMLKGLLPRLLPADADTRYIVFEGKQDLEKNLEKKLKNWMTPDTIFVVIRDKDSGDGPTIKSRLSDICSNAGKTDVLIRIACHELESWYLGDLLSVEEALEIPRLSRSQNNSKYRNPDRLGNAAQELVSLTKCAYQKVSGSRAIGKCLRITGNRSHSYNVFISGLQNRI